MMATPIATYLFVYIVEGSTDAQNLEHMSRESNKQT